jgi:hypothetical protein
VPDACGTAWTTSELTQTALDGAFEIRPADAEFQVDTLALSVAPDGAGLQPAYCFSAVLNEQRAKVNTNPGKFGAGRAPDAISINPPMLKCFPLAQVHSTSPSWCHLVAIAAPATHPLLAAL